MSRVRILVGDALARLRDLPDESVHLIVTSPPYWCLRDYGADGQIGLEADPEAFVSRLVEVFREARRVLRADGTCWLNLGDSYIGARCGGQGPGGQLAGRAVAKARANVTPEKRGRGLPPKSLVGIPWRVAFALQADGWLLRADNVWSKPSCMPESVRDRPVRSHEYVFLLAKRGSYYYDADAVRTELAAKTLTHRGGGRCGRAESQDALGEVASGNWSSAPRVVDPRGGAVRTVWTIPTQPSGIEHFATMPPALAERCILLGTSAGGACAACGAPFERQVELGEADLERQRAAGGDADGEYDGQALKDYDAAGVQDPSAVKARILAGMRERRTIGWRAPCGCPPAPPVPCVVLDPFGGAATTALVAARLNRDAVLIELNPKYAEIGRARVAEDLPLLTTVTVGPALGEPTHSERET